MSAYVEPTRPKPWGPIYTPPPPKEPTDMKTYTETEVIALLTAPLGHTELNGARERFVRDVVLDRDRLPQDVLAKAANGEDFWAGDVMTGGAATIFDLAMNRGARLALMRGVDMPHAVDQGFWEAVRDYNAGPGKGRTDGRGYTNGTGGAPPSGTLRGPIGVSGRDFEVPGL